MTMLTPKEKKDGARDLEQLADEAATKYRENPGMRPQELFIAGYKANHEEVKVKLADLQNKFDYLQERIGQMLLDETEL